MKVKWYNKFILKIFDDSIKFLAKHTNILITSADKGNVTVVMYKTDYYSKINNILDDKKYYRSIRIDPTNKLQNKNNAIIKALYNNKFISEGDKHKMTTYKAQFPKLYGLPKIHKPDCPVRPIVSAINSPCYELSRYLASILRNVTNNSKYNIQNSKEFINKLKNIRIDPNERMVSFDIVSLFTNIPNHLCLKIVGENWGQISQHTSIPKKKFFEYLEFCMVECNYFSHKGNIYKQILGLPMGSPLSPILADLVMEELLEKTLEKLCYSPKVIIKYVDDIFAILPQEQIPTTLNSFNSFHKNLQFTVELEVDNCLPYLDVRVIREQNILLTDWYQKPTASGRLIHYNSFHPRRQKINTAKNFINRILDISNVRFYNKNKNIIFKTLKENGFPKRIIESLIQSHNTESAPSTSLTSEVHPTRFRSVNYVPGLSDKLETIVKSYNPQVKLAFKNGKTVGNIFSKLKDPISKESTSDVIYNIPCQGKPGERCNMSYVGMTGQYLKNRLANHKSDLKNRASQKTALTDHCILNNHIPNYDQTTILDKESNLHKRKTLEALYIYNTKNTMNRITDLENMNVIYCALFD